MGFNSGFKGLRSGRQQHRYCWELVSIVYNSAARNAYGIYD